MTTTTLPFSSSGISKVAWSTWWELPPSSENDTTTSIARTGGALRLLRRCQVEYGWDLPFAKQVLKSYKDFLYAASFLTSDHWLIPCPLVKDVWQLHICDTQHYANDCQTLFGRIVHYNNYLLDDDNNTDETEKQRRKSKRQMIQKTIQFICEKTNQEQLDPKIWQYYYTTVKMSSDTKMKKSLKRTNSTSSNDACDDETHLEYTCRKKKMRRLNNQDSSTRSSSQTKPTKVSLEIHFTSNDDSCSPKKEIVSPNAPNDENDSKSIRQDVDDDKENHSSCQTFSSYKHAPLHRIFEQVAQTQDLDRQCLQFTFSGRVLEGSETPHTLLSKYHNTTTIKQQKTEGSNNGSNDDSVSNDTEQQAIRQSLKPPNEPTTNEELVLKIECTQLLAEF